MTSVFVRAAMEADVGATIRANTQQILKTFIQEYKSSPELWDPFNVNYTNKYRRVEAQDRLLAIYKIIQSDANRVDVRKKINTLRSNYNKEMGKVKAAEAESREYIPKNWLFHELRFLDNIKKSDCKNDLSDNDASGDAEYNQIKIENSSVFPDPMATPFIVLDNATNEQVTQSNTIQAEQLSPQISETIVNEKRKISQRRKHRISNSIARCQSIRKIDKQHPTQRISVQSPSCSYSTGIDPIALVWSSKLQGLQPTQRLYAEKAINDILFEASINNLGKGPFVISPVSTAEVQSCGVKTSEYVEYTSSEDEERED